MAKFRFRLEALKKFRDTRLLHARKELAVAEGLVQDLDKARDQSLAERSMAIQTAVNPAENFAMARALADSVLAETQRLRKIGEHRVVADAESERHRAWTAQLARELRVVERLEEKKREQFDLEQRAREKRRMDAWVAERWSHQEQPLAAEDEES